MSLTRETLIEALKPLRGPAGNREAAIANILALAAPPALWSASPEELAEATPCAGEYAVSVVFLRNLSDDANVIGEDQFTPDAAVKQLARELQDAFDDGMAGRFQIVELR